MNYKHVLSGTFYAPKFEPVFNLTMDIVPRLGVDSIHDNPSDLVGALIKEHYINYCENEYIGWDKGELNIRRLTEVCKEVAGFLRMPRVVSGPSYYGISRFINNTVISEAEADVIGYGILSEQYKSYDPDPYETAGGYRNYIAEAGTKVTFKIDNMNRLFAVVPSSLITDHYNSNFFGVSTGNGTRTYKPGERIVNRTVMIGYDIKKISDKLAVTDIMFDFEKATSLTQNNIDERIAKVVH